MWGYGPWWLASTGDNSHLDGGLACTTLWRRGTGAGLAERAAGAALARPPVHLTVSSLALVSATSSNRGVAPLETSPFNETEFGFGEVVVVRLGSRIFL